MNVTRIVLLWCGASVVMALALGRLLGASDGPVQARPGRSRRVAAFLTVGALTVMIPMSGRGGALLDTPDSINDAVATVTTLVSGPTTTTTTPPGSETDPEPDPGPTTATTRPPTDAGQPPSGSDGSNAGGSPTRTASPGSSVGVPPAATGATNALVDAGQAVLSSVVGSAGALPVSAGPTIDVSAVVPLGDFGGVHVATGSRSTAAVLALLEDLHLPPATLAQILAPFPVAGAASYSDDWGAPRLTPRPHAHEGVDVFAAKGTPVIAAADGTVTRQSSSGAGGLSVKLAGKDGTSYYYAHLERIASAIKQGARVTKGQVLGFVGTTGNAEGGPPHLHFEIHPDGGAAVPPVPYLDRWLADATETARALKAAPDSAVAALRSGRVTASAGLPAGLAPLQRTAAHRALPDLWPLALVAAAGVAGWLTWVRRLRRPARAPAPARPGFLDLD